MLKGTGVWGQWEKPISIEEVMKGDKLRSLKRFTKEHLKLKSLFSDTTRQECVGNLPPESAVGNFHFRETPHMSALEV